MRTQPVDYLMLFPPKPLTAEEEARMIKMTNDLKSVARAHPVKFIVNGKTY